MFQILRNEFKTDMSLRCHVCKKLFLNNIEFMRHLGLHVESERALATDLVDILLCHFCLKEFDDGVSLNAHLDFHLQRQGARNACKICLKTFPTEGSLINHMTGSHTKMEMPFACSICGFRSSSHTAMVTHFSECHDRTDKLQCPKCLKVFSLFSDNGYCPEVAGAFIDHLQLHLRKKHQCSKCCLSFVTDSSLKQHLNKDHLSFSNHPGENRRNPGFPSSVFT